MIFSSWGALRPKGELVWGGVVVAMTVSVYLGFVAHRIFSNGFTLAHDDAFITYAYAMNLAHGQGPVFNLGERVWGYTSPLHVFLLGGLGTLGIPIHPASIGLSLFLILPISLLFFVLLAESTGSAALSAPISLLLAPSGALFGYEGLESNLYVFGLLLFIWLAGKQRHGLTGFVAGLCCLIRPDAVLLVGPMLLIDRRLRRPSTLALFAAAPVAWLGFTALYYGTILPSSFHHKAGRFSFGEFVAYNQRGILREVIGLNAFKSWLGSWASVGLKVGLLVVAIRHWIRRSEFVLFHGFVVGPLLIWLGYAIIGAPPNHRWEVKAPMVLLSLAPLWGVTIGARWLLSRAQEQFGRSVKIAGAVVGATAVVACCVSTGILTHRSFAIQEDAESRGGRYRAYARIATWLHDHLPRKARVDLIEPGTIRYLIDRPDVRLMDGGLCSRETDVVPIKRDQPIFVLVREGPTRPSAREMPVRAKHVVQTFPDRDGYRAHVLVKVPTDSVADASTQLDRLHWANGRFQLGIR